MKPYLKLTKAKSSQRRAFQLLLSSLVLSSGTAVLADSVQPVAKQQVQSPNSKMSVASLSEMKQEALELERSGKLEEAQQILTKVTQQNPEDNAAFEQLGSVCVRRAQDYLKNNKFQEALLSTRQALSASPNNKEANQLLGQLYKTVKADPHDVVNRLKTAGTLYQQGRYQEAEVEYRTSLTEKITPDAYVGLGQVAEKLHGIGAGRPDFDRALEVDSNSASAHRELGILDMRGGDIVTANSELSRALILAPSDSSAGQSLLQLWQEQVSKFPDANSHLGLARAYQLMNNLPAAQSEYRQVVSLDPKNPSLPAARQSFKIALARQEATQSLTAARTLESQGRLLDAYRKVSEAVAYSPGNSDYMLYQGELLEKLGQPAMAKQVYMNLLEYDPKNIMAVQRIKGLPIAAGAPGQATGYQETSRINGQPDGFPGSKFPQDGAGGSPASYNGGDALGDNQVNSLSSFIGELRDNMLGPGSKRAQEQGRSFGASAGQAAGAAAQAPSPYDGFDSRSLLSSPLPDDRRLPDASSADDFAANGAVAKARAAVAAAKKTSGHKASNSLPQPSNKNASSTNSKSTASKASAAQRLQELERQNTQLKNELKQLSGNESNESETPSPRKATPPVNAGGLFTGSDFSE